MLYILCYGKHRCNSGFPNHEKSDTRKIAIEMVVTVPETTGDVGELLSSAHAAEKAANRSVL